MEYCLRGYSQTSLDDAGAEASQTTMARKSSTFSIVIVLYTPGEYRATTLVGSRHVAASGSTRSSALAALEEKLVLEDFRGD